MACTRSSTEWDTTKEEREAAQKTFDDYRKREAHKYEEYGQKRRRSRKMSMRRTMRP